MIRRVVAQRSHASPTVLPEVQSNGRVSLAEAFAYCETIARKNDHFSIIDRFLPTGKQPYAWTVYAFVRAAFDAAREPGLPREHSDETLTFLSEGLERTFHGEAEHPLFVALLETVEKCNLPYHLFNDLLEAFSQDLDSTRYNSDRALQQFITLSAHPIGRITLVLFDHRAAELVPFCDDLLTALQWTEFLVDVGIDLDRDHVYLPQEDLRHFGVTEEMLRTRMVTPEFRELMRYEVARARALFERGRPLLSRVERELAFHAQLVFQAGQMLLDKIEAADYDVFRRRPELNRADKTALVAKAAAVKWPGQIS